ncbi:RodZ domain-containing protein [Kangiella spongicola]|uniref:DUF4115 domain-containing protein n=1 Tax=Kangiella spongicola TaxID=796379 RepID=A0A318D2F0_9GAMM|nr:RodZ family helix-turn-helix domain-containing protein [Kangiella spongicola]PXF63151.1 DUF4115 domain-containing protein [Kangiella spongicola]
MTEETEQHSDNHDFGPGALLKRTREEKEISLDEVSERLKLTKSVLTQIESDEYAGDLPVTFYRGYVKNYAEFLELNETDVLANFEQFCRKNNLFKSPSAPRVEGMSLEKSVNSNNWLFKIVTGLIILALVVAIYYIVVEKELWKKVIPAGQETEQLESDDQGLELDNYEGDDGQPNSESSGSLSLPGDKPQDESDDADGSLELNTLESKNSEDSTDNDPRSDTGSLPLDDADESSSVAEEVQRNSSNVSATANSGQSLFLSFTNDCWVRIEDATGKVLALGIKSAGTNLQLSGKTPYYLNLGKASAVELSFDGNEVDLSQYPDTRAAKLTLGDS